MDDTPHGKLWHVLILIVVLVVVLNDDLPIVNVEDFIMPKHAGIIFIVVVVGHRCKPGLREVVNSLIISNLTFPDGTITILVRTYQFSANALKINDLHEHATTRGRHR